MVGEDDDFIKVSVAVVSRATFRRQEAFTPPRLALPPP